MRLEVTPSRVLLDGAESTQRLLVTGVYADGRTVDLSEKCRTTARQPAIVRVSPGVVAPASDGSTALWVELPGTKIRASVPVEVRNARTEHPLSFANDVNPILTKAGCNAGGCHGKSGGQNGFALSLLGFESAVDYASIVKRPPLRRLCPPDPARSLLLLKATGTMPHGGGRRFEVGSPSYRTLLRWIVAGSPFGSGVEPTVTRIEVSPGHRVMSRRAGQRLLVTAVYSDGSRRDVTDQAEFKSNEESIAQVDGDGHVETVDLTGETTIMARYLGQVAVARISIPMEGKIARTPDPWSLPPDAAYIDREVWKKLRELNVPPSPAAGDAEFVRRVFLDTAGTLPTPPETRAFLSDADPAKRAKLIDKLLERPEYADSWAVKWADILRVNRSLLGTDANAQKYHEWIRESLAANKPYDQFVREILTATGGGQVNGAANFYRVAFESPTAFAEITNTVSQTFLGTQIECAQCHHHPYERWTQEDFYGLAAFFARLKNKRNKEDIEYYSDAKGDLRFPRTNAVVKPHVLDGQPLEVDAASDPRAPLAAWLTAKENPLFARALVNRLWAHYLGRGLVEPIDDLRATNPASHPELLDALAKDFTDHGFDLKHITRVMLNSRTYQLTAAADKTNAQDTQNFSHAYLKRLPAEILLDAICQVTGVPETFTGMPAGTRAIQLWNSRTPSYFLDVFGRPLRVSPCECERSPEPNIGQALHLLNAAQLQEKISAPTGRLALLLKGDRPPGEIIEELYLAALARAPRAEEKRKAEEYVTAKMDRRQGLEDVLWALMNTREFLFNH